MGRFGINVDTAFGVGMRDLRPLAKELGRDQGLAQALWATGRHEARHLAIMVAEPKKFSGELAEHWAGDLTSWDLADGLCMHVLRNTSFAHDKIPEWIDDRREFVKRAGFALIATCAVHHKRLDDAVFSAYLEAIESRADDPRNFVKKAVNWALRQIGKRSVALHGPALELAQRLARSHDKTERWIGNDATRELSDPKTLARLRVKKTATL
jgi:3-methyladenine DNA glycosylase AlkD